MPTYEYECRSCHHRFERFQSITAKPSCACPRCKRKSRRLISSGGGLLFKGSGFYITDHRSASYKKKAEADSSAGAPKPKPAAPAPAKKSE
ncbi:MAG: zinc ribbon domain-containing protein [Candidatus Omnitrophica bacterium]|nr:zinc ribbon domain-containing protein [Candidatus Omnitrophota bacterium]